VVGREVDPGAAGYCSAGVSSVMAWAWESAAPAYSSVPASR
jgi:hypothetical protein